MSAWLKYGRKWFNALRRFAFGLLYRSTLLYRIVSTIFFLGQWPKWGRTVMPRLQGTRVLDVGHGPGDLLVAMTSAGYHCFGAELSPAMLEGARGNFKKARLPLPLCCASVFALPYQSAVFDNVTSTFPTEYIMRKESITEFYRVLRPGGRLIIVMSAFLLPHSLQARVLRGFSEIVEGPQGIMQHLPLGECGFHWHWEVEQLATSLVLLIVAEKPVEPPLDRT